MIAAPGADSLLQVRLYAVGALGGEKSVRSPDEPILVRMTRTPSQPGLEPREQFRAGQRELLATDFETFERNIRDQLARILSPGGFDPARDIVAITVNCWPQVTATPTNTIRCSIQAGTSPTSPTSSAGRPSAASSSRIRTRAPGPIPTSPSSRLGAQLARRW